jgi:glycosyltransferase involved in cell wall biosynthesis
MANTGRRVLFLARHLDSGGVTTHMMTLACGLRRQGWQVALASGGAVGDHHRGPSWFEEHGIQHFTIPFMGPRPRGKDYLTPFISAFRLDSLIRSFQPSIIHVHWRSASPYACLEHLLRRVPFVSTLHVEVISSGGLMWAGSRWGETAIAVSSEAKACLMSRLGVPERKISIVFNGCDAQWFHPPSPEEKAGAKKFLGLTEGGPVVSLVGRLEKVKRHEVLLRAARLAKDADPKGLHGLQVVLAGEGPRKADLRSLAKELGIEDCTHFLGHVDARPVLWASDISVLTSLQEGFGIVIVEAMLCGVPVIRTRVGGAVDQIVDGTSGYIIPVDDSRMLAERICALATDTALSRRIATAGLQRARDLFTVDCMVERTEQVYEQAMMA